jgi:hypothetical protein
MRVIETLLKHYGHRSFKDDMVFIRVDDYRYRVLESSPKDAGSNYPYVKFVEVDSHNHEVGGNFQLSSIDRYVIHDVTSRISVFSKTREIIFDIGRSRSD